MAGHFLKVPHIQQRSDADCLVACAAMVLDFAGFRANYNQLLRLLGTSEVGTPYSRIQRLSRIHPDLHLIYREGDLDILESYVDNGHPVGIFVDSQELPYWDRATGHAVVVAGYSDQIFLVHDPAINDSPQTVMRGDLQLAWQAFDSYLFVVQRKQSPR